MKKQEDLLQLVSGGRQVGVISPYDGSFIGYFPTNPDAQPFFSPTGSIYSSPFKQFNDDGTVWSGQLHLANDHVVMTGVNIATPDRDLNVSFPDVQVVSRYHNLDPGLVDNLGGAASVDEDGMVQAFGDLPSDPDEYSGPY